MDYENLLAYQKADTSLRRLNQSLASGEKKRKLDTIRAAYGEERKRADAAEAKAAQIMSAYAETEKKVNELIARVNALVKEESEESLAKLSALKEELAKYSSTLASLKSQSAKALGEYKSAQDNGKKYRVDYDKASIEYNEEKAKVEPQVKELEKQAADLRAKVDPELLQRYDSLIALHIINPFVAAHKSDKSDKTYKCGGCFMELSQSLADTLEESGFCQCDSCKRIIFKKQ
jgi:predicted  nucleic acid-binding Zn-ribbon protein